MAVVQGALVPPQLPLPVPPEGEDSSRHLLKGWSFRYFHFHARTSTIFIYSHDYIFALISFSYMAFIQILNNPAAASPLNRSLSYLVYWQ